jgi:hypothetical protein
MLIKLFGSSGESKNKETEVLTETIFIWQNMKHISGNFIGCTFSSISASLFLGR